MSSPGTDDAWTSYAEALGRLHHARDAAYQAFRAGQFAAAERSALLERLAGRLAEQRATLEDLAGRLRAKPGSVDLTPAAVPPLADDAGLTDLHARADDVDGALAETRQAAVLPQLLPDWRSQFARAAVVYTGFAIPSLVLTVLLSLAGVTGHPWTLGGFFIVIWPAVTAFGGGAVVRHVSQPRAGDDLTFRQERFDSATTFEQKTRAVLGKLGHREPLHRWFGVLVAWASWFVTGTILDGFAAIWPG